MNNVQGVGTTTAVSMPEANRTVNFRAQTATAQNDSVDTFIKEREKERKRAKRAQNANLWFMGVLGATCLASLAIALRHEKIFKKFKLNFKDISKEMDLDKMALPESQKAAAKRISNFIEHHKEIVEMGGPNGTSILFYGPPGTGKNTFAYAITKKFPNSKFLEMDISKMNSMWHGESEKNVLGTMEAAVKYAKKHPDEKIFVFIDEIDSVMMKDRGNGAKISNDILNAFKKGFNDLTNQNNIIVMGATNLKINPEQAMLEGKMLDSAMLDRFAEKVLVDLPTKEQIKLAITNYYSDAGRTRVDEQLKDINNAKLDKLAAFLADKKHGTSFRTLIKGILQPTACQKEISSDAKVTMDDIINTIKNVKENLNATDAEIQALINSIK